ncbi:MAG: phage virion morphogenesis protein [Magnetococcus sp. DMHC-6]
MVTLEVDESAWTQLLSRLRGAIDTVDAGLEDAGLSITDRIAMHMAQEVDPQGQPWPRLAPATRQRRQRLGKGGASMLNVTGALRRSLYHRSKDEQLAIGFERFYALYHEFGVPGKKLPRRGLLLADTASGQVAERDLETVVQGLLTHIQEAVDG